MRRFFTDCSNIADTPQFITGSDAKHIKNVLRLRPGDEIVLADGTGFEHEARIEALFPDKIELSVIRSSLAETESSVQIIVAQALLKDKKMDGLVRQLTELGITRWIPFIADRSVPKPKKDRINARVERWKKIAREAVKQCRRARIPEVDFPVSFEHALDIAKTCDLKIAFWENESESFNMTFSSLYNKQYNKIFVMIGPEGGFTSEETESCRTCGFVTAGLGPRILRAETATIAACTLIQFFFGDMGKEP
ncbi:MAG: 16S rRNA (uracil(1498)-N(3))-methyltransferase [Desulfobacteraceae bacterium]|nr:16S rRNA (uracil(1498)-N(3))-methyltransferase [Desulfobacteraceae bacterium]